MKNHLTESYKDKSRIAHKKQDLRYVYELNESVGEILAKRAVSERGTGESDLEFFKEYLALEGIWNKKPNVLSGGELQRLAISGCVNMRRSTPNASLEIIFDLCPLDLFFEEKALNTYIRIQGRNTTIWDGIGNNNSRSHLFWSQNRLRTMGLFDFESSDAIPSALSWERLFTIDVASFDEGAPKNVPDLCCYTDGSGIDGRIGWGFCIRNRANLDIRDSGSLASNNTVFQSEIVAIHQASLRLLQTEGTSVHFFVDSQAALLALKSTTVDSLTVQNCIDSLNELGLKMCVTLCWVKAHVGHELNEIADDLAKAGSMVANQTESKMPTSYFKKLINDFQYKVWKTRWQELFAHWQSKIWLSGPNKNRSKLLLKLGRSNLSKCIQVITGHSYLGYHMNKINPYFDPTCRRCKLEVETAWHLASECDGLHSARLNALQQHCLGNPPYWDPVRLSRFCSSGTMTSLLAYRE